MNCDCGCEMQLLFNHEEQEVWVCTSESCLFVLTTDPYMGVWMDDGSSDVKQSPHVAMPRPVW